MRIVYLWRNSLHLPTVIVVRVKKPVVQAALASLPKFNIKGFNHITTPMWWAKNKFMIETAFNLTNQFFQNHPVFNGLALR